MRMLRVTVGLFLALIVASVNGVATYAYLGLATFDVSGSASSADDPRWKATTTDDGIRFEPSNELAYLSLLTDSKYGKFAWFLLVLCHLQFIAGMTLIFVSRAGWRLQAFFVLVAVLGIIAEILGAEYSSSFGPINWLGVVVSVLLVAAALSLRKSEFRSTSLPEPPTVAADPGGH